MKWLSRALVLIVSFLSANLIAEVGEPKPYYVKLPIGFAAALAWDFPLWISTFKVATKWRWPLALAILLTGIATIIAMCFYNLIIASGVAAIHLYLIVNLITAKNT
ncbi:MAG TPA: hypothetical protein PLH57_01980 [Oligoflexia bacterium]|nr:hypothetical protein [Oligoflexia bacterium]